MRDRFIPNLAVAIVDDDYRRKTTCHLCGQRDEKVSTMGGQPTCLPCLGIDEGD